MTIEIRPSDLTGEELGRYAKRLEERVNAAITEHAPRWHWLEYEARTDALVRSIIGPGWEWTLDKVLAKPPYFCITGYDYRRTK